MVPISKISSSEINGEAMSALFVIDKKKFSVRPCFLALNLCIFALCLVFAGVEAASASDFNVRVTPVAQMQVDDDGKPLGYPVAVFYDPTQDEIYVAQSGNWRIIVYGPDFFPRSSIGIGRGVNAPRGGEVLPNGQVYICQTSFGKTLPRRITILNGAFFVDQEINLQEIPEAEGFSPKQVAVTRDGLIYVAGENYRGVLVLDKEGVFLRKLQPMDTIHDARAIAEVAGQQEVEENQTKEEEALPGENDEKSPTEGKPGSDIPEKYADIPEQFRPRSSQDGAARGPVEGIGPVRVNYVSLDNSGNIYLLSAETGKIYVFGPDETFRFSFGQKGGSPRQLSQPRGLAIDEEKGLIYVVDYMRHTVLTYDLSGKFLYEFGGRGAGPGWLNFPCGIAVNRHGQVIVADQFNKRVQVLEVENLGLMGMPEAPVSAPPSAENADAGTPKEGTDSKTSTEGSDNTGSTVLDESAPPQSDGTIEEVVMPLVEIPGQPDNGMDGQAPSDGKIPGKTDSTSDQKQAPEIPSPGQVDPVGEH
jgi:DNA-binding beta-propeller fold protein YncE